MYKNQSKFDEIRSYLRDVQSKVNAVRNHPISKVEEYVSDLYFDMLCVIAQYNGYNSDDKKCFIQNIMASCPETLTIDEYCQRALVIDKEKTNEFIIQCQKKNLCKIFFIDALLITYMDGKPDRETLEFLAEFGDAFGFDKYTIKSITNLVSIIINKDFKKLENYARFTKDAEDFLNISSCYIQPIIDKNIISDDRNLYYYSLKKPNSPVFTEKKIFSNLESITIKNQLINKQIRFESIKSVVLVNCNLYDYEESGILYFKNVLSVSLINCKIKNCNTGRSSGGTLEFNCTEKIRIKNCLFQNCGNRNCGTATFQLSQASFTKINIINSTFNNINSIAGGIFSTNNKSYIKIFNSRFNNCCAKYCGSIGYFYEGTVDVENCEFFDCKDEEALFYGQVKYYGIGNYFSNCSPIIQ